MKTTFVGFVPKSKTVIIYDNIYNIFKDPYIK